MEKIFKSIFLVLCLFTYNMNIKSLTYGGCEYSQISRLKSIVSNINISYDYNINNNIAYFNITISNLTPDIYFVDMKTSKKYYYNNANDGEITIYNVTNDSGNYRFYSAINKCYGIKLGDKFYNLPTYNYYYNDPLCQANPDFSLCKKWGEVNYSRGELEKLINEYNNKNNNEEIVPEKKHEETLIDKIMKFYVKNYYFILGGIIAICIPMIVIIRRKNKFDL